MSLKLLISTKIRVHCVSTDIEIYSDGLCLRAPMDPAPDTAPEQATLPGDARAAGLAICRRPPARTRPGSRAGKRGQLVAGTTACSRGLLSPVPTEDEEGREGWRTAAVLPGFLAGRRSRTALYSLVKRWDVVGGHGRARPGFASGWLPCGAGQPRASGWSCRVARPASAGVAPAEMLCRGRDLALTVQHALPWLPYHLQNKTGEEDSCAGFFPGGKAASSTLSLSRLVRGLSSSEWFANICENRRYSRCFSGCL